MVLFHFCDLTSDPETACDIVLNLRITTRVKDENTLKKTKKKLLMIPHSHGHSDSLMQPVETSSNMGSSTCPCSYCVTAHHLTALSLCIPEAGPRSLYEQSCD